MKQLFLKALLCLGVAVATLIVGLVFHQNFSWLRLKAQVAVFVDTLAYGEAGEIVTALTSAPVIGGGLVIVVGAVLIWDSFRKKRH